MEFLGIHRGSALVVSDVIPFAAAILLHEAGHFFGAWLARVPFCRWDGGRMGWQLRFATAQISYGQELVVLLSGSVCGFLSLLVAKDPRYVRYALGLNLVNLLPLSGLDGGGILTCLLHLIGSGDMADRVVRIVSRGTALLFWIGGMWIALRAGGDLTWMLVGLGMLLGK